jgi:hypothetical protein
MFLNSLHGSTNSELCFATCLSPVAVLFPIPSSVELANIVSAPHISPNLGALAPQLSWECSGMARKSG